MAAKFNHTEIVEQLLKAGACRCHDLQIPVQGVVGCGLEPLFRLIFFFLFFFFADHIVHGLSGISGALPNEADSSHKTPLMLTREPNIKSLLHAAIEADKSDDRPQRQLRTRQGLLLLLLLLSLLSLLLSWMTLLLLLL